MALSKASAEFYSDTPWLAPLGVYVWGDALVLMPFWIVSLGSLVYLDKLNAWGVEFYLAFLWVRSAIEILYWVGKQMKSTNDFVPPQLRQVSWMTPDKAAILFQLYHTVMLLLIPFGYLIFATKR